MRIKTFYFGNDIEVKVRFFSKDEYPIPKIIHFKNDDGTVDENVQKQDAYYKTKSGFYAEYVDVIMEKDNIEYYVELQKKLFETLFGKVQQII